MAQKTGELRGVLVPGRAHNRTQTGKHWSKASKLLTFHAGISRQRASPEDLRLARRNATFKRAKNDSSGLTHSGCNVKPSWTDRGQRLTHVFSRKQNKQGKYLGGIAVHGCGVSKYADKKQK